MEKESCIDKCECRIHSPERDGHGVLAEATIIKRLGDNDYPAEYNGVKCHAIFNPVSVPATTPAHIITSMTSTASSKSRKNAAPKDNRARGGRDGSPRFYGGEQIQ
jgi:hypothetical protein